MQLIIVRTLLALSLALAASPAIDAAEPIRIAAFEVDATPPLGTPISYSPAKEVMDPLGCRGVLLLSNQLPIVLCSIDWLSLRNGAHDAFRLALAEAAQTSPDRVAIHVVHQHDAPSYDFDAELIMKGHGVGFPADFARDTIRRAAEAIRAAKPKAKAVTRIGLGKGKVDRVASNRRIVGLDGKVALTRWSSSTKPEAAAAPEGLIDPYVRLIAFANEDGPLAALTYYATHPQSYYTRGSLSADFVGMARSQRQEATEVPHIHFNGAAGNITAGKYNDGDPANRPVLADRLVKGMQTAWEDVQWKSVSSKDLEWRAERVALPPASNLVEGELIQKIAEDPTSGASALAWLHRANSGYEIQLACLALSDARVLHMPGELFIEYQLAAQKARPDLFVAMAAYGDGGPGYIGTRVAYPQGGYEVGSPSKVAPEVEDVLFPAIKRLLEVEGEVETPSELTDTYPVFDP